MRLLKFSIAILMWITSTTSLSAQERSLLSFSCTAKDYLSVSTDINSGVLQSSHSMLNAAFKINVTSESGVIRVTSPQFKYISFYVNIKKEPNRIKRMGFYEALSHGLIVESKDLKFYGDLGSSDLGFFLNDINGTLKITRGTRSGKTGGFFTESFSGETRTLSFTCETYNEAQWRAFSKPVYDYVRSALTK